MARLEAFCCRRRRGWRVDGSQGHLPGAGAKAGLVSGARRWAPEQRMELGHVFLPHPRSCPGRTLGLGTKEGLVAEGRSVTPQPLWGGKERKPSVY